MVSINKRGATKTVVIAVALAALAVIALGGYRWFKAATTNTYTAFFPVAASLYKGDPVRVLGVNVGTVDSITPRKGDVKVVLRVDKDVDIPADASFSMSGGLGSIVLVEGARPEPYRREPVDHDRPVCFLAYTIKGWGTPIAGHKDNHGGLMTRAQMEAWQRHMGVAFEFENFHDVSLDARGNKAGRIYRIKVGSCRPLRLKSR